jgi:ribonuclease Y
LTQNSQYDIIFLKSMNFDPLYIILSSVAFGIGAVLGYLSRKRLASLDARFLEQKIREKLTQAENQAEKIILRAKEEAMRIIEDGKRRLDEERAELKKRELRIERERLKLEEEKMLLPKQKKELAENLEKARELKRRLESLEEERRKALEKISGLTKEEAKKLLFEKIEKE